ncbi:SH3 domain-containing RING finger protein 3 [Sinocyclocheilus anshuiensis]|uniref:SH3 domain-containing RING finger protein 3 n=1 Tax=Sinocyclocheilus anshuiensis TaxID=1608454 RepID=UPI0007B94A63|nr:PREDICTED: SH3 domain-containing RING finger protein 3 [Sinocyclocheilus anshuiensis]
MDESSLLDLLECSVCLERLDTSAKVLPCQHTFCRRCLENIVSSRHELRCPECRVLVDCAVDDLPANILLVRLLDGIKQRPRNGGGRPALAGCAAGVSASPPGTAVRDLPVATRSSPVKNVPQLPCGKALYSYEGKEAGDLKFSKGDIIILRRKVDENWFHGELNGSHGFLPASYIQCIRPLSQTPPQGKALYDFEVKDKDQDKDCLTFTKDEILTVIRRVDDNWAEGILGDKIGIFPILYVELNETAKQLMEMDKPSAAPGPSAESPAAVSCNGNAVHRYAEGKKNAKKRHSFTALSVTQRSAQVLGSNRHSMEISAPVLISSSDPRAAARITDCPHLSSSAPATQDSSVAANAAALVPPRVTSTTGELLAAAKVQLPLNIYLAMYAYKPQKADELELRKGEMYRVMEKCQDGWFKGTSLRSGASGVFPGNYVTPVSSPSLPTWDLPTVLRALKGPPFEPLQSTNLRSLSLKTVLLLALALVKRIGDLQALSVSPACLEFRPNDSKTRSCLSGAAPGSPGSAGPSSPVLLASASASRSSTPLSSPSSPQLHLKNCLRMCSQQTVNQARSAMQLVHSPPVSSSPERPTASVTPLRPQASPSRSPARPLSMTAAPQPHAASVRPLRPLSSITPPNASAAHLNAADLHKLQDKKLEKKEKKSSGLLKLLSGAAAKKKSRSPPSVSPTHESCSVQGAMAPELRYAHVLLRSSGSVCVCKQCLCLSQKEKKSSGLLKLLSGAAAKKKSRSPPSVSPTHESCSVQGAMAPELRLAGGHGRAGSCPIESEMQGAMSMEPLQRKSGSLDLSFSVSPPARQPCSSSPLAIRPEPKPLSRERYRVLVPYPPQSEAEIELKEGDIVFVHKKREDGWYKGTLQRTGRTGLFPGSFVESF